MGGPSALWAGRVPCCDEKEVTRSSGEVALWPRSEASRLPAQGWERPGPESHTGLENSGTPCASASSSGQWD